MKRKNAFAERLKSLRQNAGLTQEELAKKARLSHHGLTKLEQGDRKPTWETVQALCKALGVSCEEFAEK